LPIIQVVAASLRGLFGQHFDGTEMRLQAGAAELVALLRGVALGDQDAPVTSGEHGHSLGHIGQQLNLLVGDGLRKAEDARVFLRGQRLVGELLEARDQGLAKTLQPVAGFGDGGALAGVQTLPHLGGRMHTVVQVGDERGDRALKIDIVLPQRVVGVEQQGLAGRLADGLDVGGHGGLLG
jgi:hypothetical protein